jgi:Tol biopolymer transport system component
MKIFMRKHCSVARVVACAMLAFPLASCSSSSDGPKGPRTLTNMIVFVSNRIEPSQLYIMTGDGKAVQRIPSTDSPKADPEISPDGKKIVFTSSGPLGIEDSPLWIVNADGSGLQQLTFGGSWDHSPTWSPDGAQIAFTRSGEGTNDEIYVMNADGSGQTNISNDEASDNSPSWSPSGNTILFDSNRDRAVGDQVYSMTSTGASVTPLVLGYAAKWSPTGSRFLFERGAHIYISDTRTGSTVRQVGTETNYYVYPHWSSDESKIVFPIGSNSHIEIWTINSADGGGAIQLTPDGDGDNYSPSWSRH